MSDALFVLAILPGWIFPWVVLLWVHIQMEKQYARLKEEQAVGSKLDALSQQVRRSAKSESMPTLQQGQAQP